MAHSLYVVIPTTVRPSLLDRTLLSLSQCRFPSSYRQTLVIENGPERVSEAIVTAHHPSLNTRYMYDPYANKSNALNRVLDVLDDGLILFLDDDVSVHPDILHAYHEVAAGTEAGFYYGGPVTVDYEQEPAKWLIPYLPASARGWTIKDKTTATDICFLGCNWAAFTGDLKRIGGFDISRGPGSETGSMGEETTAQLKLYAIGIKAKFVPEAFVAHYVPKKRCTPVWVLKRLYRKGVNDGLWGRDQVRDQKQDSFKERNLTWFKEELVMEIAKGNGYAVFGLLRKLSYLLGYLKGKVWSMFV